MKPVTRLVLMLAMLVAAPLAPARATNPLDLVNNAAAVVRGFMQSDRALQVTNLAKKSKAVFIVPSYYKAGFIIGGSGGVGVLVAREPRGSGWGYPAFANIGGASLGLQAGGSASELLIFIMSDRGLESLVNNQLRIGGSAGLAFATLGAEVSGSKGLTSGADFVTIARSVGVYAGINLEGAAIEQRMDLARNFYGQPASIYPIVMLGQYQSPAATPLREALMAAETGNIPALPRGGVAPRPNAMTPAPSYSGDPAPITSGQVAPGFTPPAAARGVEVINQPYR